MHIFGKQRVKVQGSAGHAELVEINGQNPEQNSAWISSVYSTSSNTLLKSLATRFMGISPGSALFSILPQRHKHSQEVSDECSPEWSCLLW